MTFTNMSRGCWIRNKGFLQVLSLPKQVLDDTDAVNNELVKESLTAAAFV
jgi:hypothetical protein